jgi:glycosyltransferase involved in cell wall biosynthesis
LPYRFVGILEFQFELPRNDADSAGLPGAEVGSNAAFLFVHNPYDAAAGPGNQWTSYLRVLHAYKVFPPDVMGGIPEVIAYIAKGMFPRHDSSLLVARSRGWGRRYTFDTIPVEAVFSFGTLLSTPIAPSFPFVLARRSRQAALVALHHPFPLNDIGVALGLPSRTPLVVHWHSEIVRARPLAGLLAPFIRHTLARAQRIIVSHSSLVSESPFLAAHGEKCAIIPYGIDVPYWNELDSSQRRQVEELRSRHPRLVMATGRLVPYKGFDVLIEALRRVDATAIIVGEGPLRNDLLRMAQQRGVAERVILAGMLSRDDLKVHLHAAQLYAFPSVSAAEAFGIVQLEAMAAGLPIVNTDLPTGVPHVARHGLEALTVPPNDPAALATAISQLLADRELAQRLGAAGRSRAMTEYNLENFVKRTEEVYDQAVRAARSTRSGSAGVFGRLDDKPSL